MSKCFSSQSSKHYERHAPQFNEDKDKQRRLKVGLSFGKDSLTVEGNLLAGCDTKKVKYFTTIKGDVHEAQNVLTTSPCNNDSTRNE